MVRFKATTEEEYFSEVKRRREFYELLGQESLNAWNKYALDRTDESLDDYFLKSKKVDPAYLDIMDVEYPDL